VRAHYAKAVAHTWRRSDAADRTFDPLEFVRCACLAASSHNTQPWSFELDRDLIFIRPDFSRQCPAVDPDDHHLYASLGCAAENLVVAAQASGRSAEVSYDPATTGVRISFGEVGPSASPLFEAIFVRQCTRTVYDGSALSPSELRKLESLPQEEGVSLLLLQSEQQKRAVADYVLEGNRLQFADPAWAAELRSWIRFDARTAVRTSDGLYGPVMGNPDVPPWFGRLVMKMSFSAEAQNRTDLRNIGSSGAIAVIHSAANDPEHWIATGRYFERLALQAAALDLRIAFINQPVEVSHLRAQFAQYLGIGNRRPDLVIRIGHAPLGIRSLRRPPAEVMVARRPEHTS